MKKKQKQKQSEIKFTFDVKWKYLSGIRGYDCPDSGVTRMEAVTAEEAERLWKVSHCYAQRKFKVLSVTEVPDTQPNPTKHAKRNTETEHRNFDSIPSFDAENDIPDF